MERPCTIIKWVTKLASEFNFLVHFKYMCPGGETGRRTGLKILSFLYRGVPVQVRPRAPKIRLREFSYSIQNTVNSTQNSEYGTEYRPEFRIPISKKLFESVGICFLIQEDRSAFQNRKLHP
jgi:hypothetical protein